ncbi:hypothetical protein TS85_22485 [Sphingomonas hengshuiensis]|uniref:Homogentisate 1,2-dioxygenase n=2 Tax=Sphingomonas hengshuiensis TaxID=1609977 RepID=A0A7U4LGV5_9SPHN|nr:hypothetical protein TS85_22485 [Sphingomonas hengshuiensis]
MLSIALAFTLAAAAPPPCTTRDAALPRALAGWTRAGRGLDTGHTVTLPVRRGAATTIVRIRKAGLFGIAADRDGWIDIAPARGKPLSLDSEPRVPACSTIKKIVRFRLRPGSYRVSVAKLKADRVRLMLVRYG